MTRYTQFRALLSAPILPAGLGVLLLVGGFGFPASGQSFDCRNARSADEKAICQDSRLGDLDKQLADVYDRAGGKLSKAERAEFENHETAFVNARRRCGEHRACIEQSYHNRIQELLSGLPEDQSSRSGSPGETKRSDRSKAARDNGKPEDAQSGTEDTKRATGEAVIQAPERTPVQDNRQSGAPSPSPAETRSRPSEPAAATAAVPNPPSRREAEAALSGSPPAEKHSHRKSRTENVAVTPAAPERDEPPASARPALEKHPAPEKHPSKSAAAPAPERHPATPPSAAVPEQHPAAGSTTAAAEPSNPPEKRHSRGKPVASGTSAPSPAPADQAQSASKPEIKWVNPAPSH